MYPEGAVSRRGGFKFNSGRRIEKIVPQVKGKSKGRFAPVARGDPRFEVGRVRRIKELIEAMRHQKTLFFCWDYLNGPYTEPTLTSGLSVAGMVHAALDHRSDNQVGAI